MVVGITKQRNDATHCGTKGGHEMKVQNLETGCTALNRSLVSRKPVTNYDTATQGHIFGYSVLWKKKLKKTFHL